MVERTSTLTRRNSSAGSPSRFQIEIRHGGKGAGRTQSIRCGIPSNRALWIATSASWNVIKRPWRTTLAPILMTLSRCAVSNQATTFQSSPYVRVWLDSDIPWGTQERLLLSRKPTFEGQRPLSHRFRLLYTQEQTFMRSPPDFCS